MTDTNSTLEGLRTEKQRRIDTIAQIRKYGFENILPLPQIVGCGHQSSGKSSILKAPAKIPFPKNDNLCTKVSTEVNLQHEPKDKLTVKVIPNNTQPLDKQKKIKSFSKSVINFEEWPIIIDATIKVISISDNKSISGKAFAIDTLSIKIKGPNQPQVTLVNIPGLISSATKRVSDSNIAMVADITDNYIS
jgi:hypothetical protein